MAQKLTIEFEPRGDKNLIKAMKDLNAETLKLQKSSTKLANANARANKTTQRVTGATNAATIGFLGLGGKLSVVRSRLLLYSFAMTLALRPLTRMVKATLNANKEFEALETRLKSMTGSSVKAAKAFDTFNKVAAKTPFTLKDITEAGVALQAFGANAEEAIVPVADLAAFMGVNATEAAQAFGRAFAGGAGAADVLRERGVLELVKSFKGIKDITKLTLPEFREALMSAMKDPALGIAGATEALAKTFSGSLSNMQDSMTRFAATVGEKMSNPMQKLMNRIGGAADALTDFLSIPDKFESGAIGFERNQDKLAKLTLPELQKRLEDAKKEVEKYGEAVIDVEKPQQKLNDQLKPAIDTSKDYTMSIIQQGGVLDDLIITQGEITAQNKDMVSTLQNLGFEMPILNDALQKEAEVMELASGTAITFDGTLLDLQANVTALLEAIDRKGEPEGLFKKLFGALGDPEKMDEVNEAFELMQQRVDEFASLEIESEKQAAEARIAIIDETEKKELEALRNTRDYKYMTDKQKAKSEKQITDLTMKQREKIRKEANDDIKRAFRATQVLKASQAIMNTAEQITLNLDKPWKIAFIAAMGAIQLATIKAEKPPKMQYGGLVGGRRHSSGGTMLEAEQGEFVVSRAGVEATGIEALNRINAGTRGAGGTSIVINNPILGKDTIEDEIIPQIAEALRRGSDLGI